MPRRGRRLSQMNKISIVALNNEHIKHTSLLLGDIGFSLICLNRAKDDIHLFQTATLGLRDQKREGTHTEDVDRGEHQEDLVAEIGDEGRCNLGQNEVEQPLRRAGDSKTVVPRASVEDIRDIYPTTTRLSQ